MSGSLVDTLLSDTVTRIAAAVPDDMYAESNAFVHDDNANSEEGLLTGHSVTRRFVVLTDGGFKLMPPIGQGTEWSEIETSFDVAVAYQIGRSSVSTAQQLILKDRDRLIYELTRTPVYPAGLIRRQVTGAGLEFAEDGGVAVLRLSLALRYRPSFA